MSDKVLLIGMGLMGGSFYKCLTQLGYDIICIDTNELVVANVLSYDDSVVFISYGEVMNYEFKYTIVTCYPDNVLSVFADLNNNINDDCVVMEMSGLKCSFVDELSQLSYSFDYILAHPMAGLEKYGFENSYAQLFKDANFCYITDVIKVNSLKDVNAFVYEMGFKSFVGMTSYAHDQAITYVSHLPHVLALIFLKSELLTNTAIDVAASSFADVVRVGNVDIDLWKWLLNENHENIGLQLDQIISECERVKTIVADEVMLENYMAEAKAIHLQIYK
jgi:prephenate dehydrogenase